MRRFVRLMVMALLPAGAALAQDDAAERAQEVSHNDRVADEQRAARNEEQAQRTRLESRQSDQVRTDRDRTDREAQQEHERRLVESVPSPRQ